VNMEFENAHVAVCMSVWTSERLGQFYEERASAISEWTPEIIAYRNAAEEY
jgi:hypothetical protein